MNLAVDPRTEKSTVAEMRCLVCGAPEVTRGVRIENVPAHAVRLYKSRAEALSEPLGVLDLVGCQACGFVFNGAYNPSLHRYDAQYESTQSFSPAFNAFNRELAQSILDATTMSGPIVEIGCGNGELLALLLELDDRPMIGFDPAYSAEHCALPKGAPAVIHARNFDPSALHDTPAAIVSKMTLEHVSDPVGFLTEIAMAIPVGSHTRVFIQVPNAGYIFQKDSIGDLLYEHCNYFSARSLNSALSMAGLQSTSLKEGFGGQYLLSISQLARNEVEEPGERRLGELSDFASFSRRLHVNASAWSEWVNSIVEDGGKLAFWGGASKAVGFLSVTQSTSKFQFAIDINPRKLGSYLPGTAIEVRSPEMAACSDITDILVCNPIYMDEIASLCRRLGIRAKLHPMTMLP
ncbi:MAG: methyltransferase domain-containing protein [Pseudomonadota bacterium]